MGCGIIMGLLREFWIYFVSLCWLQAATAKYEDLVLILMNSWLGFFIYIISLVLLECGSYLMAWKAMYFVYIYLSQKAEVSISFFLCYSV